MDELFEGVLVLLKVARRLGGPRDWGDELGHTGYQRCPGRFSSPFRVIFRRSSQTATGRGENKGTASVDERLGALGAVLAS